MDQTLINRIVEAALLAASQPLGVAQLRELFPEDQPAPAGAIEAAIEHLQADCETRGVELVEVATGFRYQVKAQVHGWITRLWTERQTRYTRATLETLALIAYRQPITRGEIEQVRGVTVSSNIIKALEEREWIRVVGHRDVPGRPALFGTTKGFLDYFGLKRLDELPPLSELKDIGELEPQLAFDEASRVSPRIAVGIDGGAGGLAAEAANDVDAADEASDGTATAVDAADANGASASDTNADFDVAADGADGADGDTKLAAADPGALTDTDTDTDIETDAGTDLARGERVPSAAHDSTSIFTAVEPIEEPDSDTEDDADDRDLDFRSERPVVFEDDESDPILDAANGDVEPETAPGERAVHENDREQDNAVETTTVPEITSASSDAAESNDHE